MCSIERNCQFTQLSRYYIIVLFNRGNQLEATEGTFMRLVRFAAAFVIYTVVDVVWNILPFVQSMYESLHAASGNDRSIYGKQIETWGGMEMLSLLIFFLLIALANSHLVIEPAVREGSVRKAVIGGFVLGCGAYATYIVPTFVATANWPVVLVPIDIIIGGTLSLITSTAVVALSLRLMNKS